MRPASQVTFMSTDVGARVVANGAQIFVAGALRTSLVARAQPRESFLAAVSPGHVCRMPAEVGILLGMQSNAEQGT